MVDPFNEASIRVVAIDEGDWRLAASTPALTSRRDFVMVPASGDLARVRRTVLAMMRAKNVPMTAPGGRDVRALEPRPS